MKFSEERSVFAYVAQGSKQDNKLDQGSLEWNIMKINEFVIETARIADNSSKLNAMDSEYVENSEVCRGHRLEL